MNDRNNTSDARKSPRFTVDVAAVVTLPSGQRLPARTRDLSRTGICLISTDAVPAGTDATLELVLAFGEDSYSEPLAIVGRVVWCTPIEHSFQLGAMFDDVTEEQDGFLEMFLHFLDGTLSPKGIPDDDADDRIPLTPDEKDDPFK